MKESFSKIITKLAAEGFKTKKIRITYDPRNR